MYQFYYADESKKTERGVCKENIRDKFHITAIRPAMWEEHCLECSAPVCFESCVYYQARSDGRCKRFDNGLLAFMDEKACCGQGVHVKFRKWGNMMTVLFPTMLVENDYQTMFAKNQKLGKQLKSIADSKLPQPVRWQSIRSIEYARRRGLRALDGADNTPDAFLFHGYSYGDELYRLIVEVYHENDSVFKLSIPMRTGENLHIIPAAQLSPECANAGNLIKVYPENNVEAELDILWCDFVQGEIIAAEEPAHTVKCVVWDLDNTIWNGTLIETEDSDRLQLKQGVLDTIKGLDDRGIIQSISSKNDFQAAWPVLERLRIAEYFLYPQIHWNAKSDAIEQIAKKLNIGIDTLAFIDDTVFEREQVRSVWPQVRVYDVDVLPTLLSMPEFAVPVTEESKHRRAMYKAEEKRNEIKNSSGTDALEFLRRCNLRINVFDPKTEAERLRCYELVVRTNQLNMSGKKYTPQEFEEVLTRPNHRNFAFSCVDDFGEYGIVGYGQYRVEGNQLTFTEFAMSCRVAGKYVESALFTYLLTQENCTSGIFTVAKTKKNALLRATLDKIGFQIQSEQNDRIIYMFDRKLKNVNVVGIENGELLHGHGRKNIGHNGCL